jgi:D-alanine-D-alanine ligase
MVKQSKLRVAVLMGGISSERDISLSTGKQILQSLDPEKYEAIGVDAALMPGSSRSKLKGAANDISTVAEAGKVLAESNALVSVDAIAGDGSSQRPDVVLIALHGKFGEDGTVQGMLDLLGVPYTGSGVLASALCMDKSMTKNVLASDGIPVPESVDFTVVKGQWDRDAVAEAVGRIGYPVVVKPSRQGSTIGMTKVNSADGLNNAISEAAAYDEQIIVEQFIRATELTVGVLGTNNPQALPVIEIVPKGGFYDYEAKYAPGGSEHFIPARIGDAETKQAQEIAVKAFKSLGCRGMARVDIMLSDNGMYVLEVNTIPGMTPTSLLPEAAKAKGIGFSELLDTIIGFALED